MANCKQCNATIPDGTQVCKSCIDKDKIKSNESYLDSLLNSVKNSKPDVESIYKRKNATRSSNEESPVTTEDNIEISQKPLSDDFVDYTVDMKDIEDFDRYFDEAEAESEIIGDEELFGEGLSVLLNKSIADYTTSDEGIADIHERVADIHESDGIFINDSNINKSIRNESIIDESIIDESILDESINDESIIYESIDDDSIISKKIADENFADANTIDQLIIDESVTEDINSVISDEADDLIDAINNEISDISENILKDTLGYNDIDSSDVGINEDLRDIINSLESSEGNDTLLQDTINDSMTNSEYGSMSLNESDKAYRVDNYNNELTSDFQDISDLVNNQNIDEEAADDYDFLNLLNEISSDDPVAKDAKAISDMLNSKSAEINGKAGTPSDVGEVFSDALKVVSSLNDPNHEDAELLDRLIDINKKSNKKKNKKDKSKIKKSNKKKSELSEDEDAGAPANKNKKPKTGLLKRIFGNVPDENNKSKAGNQKELQDESAAAKEKNKKGKSAKLKKVQNTAAQIEDDLESEDKKAVAATDKKNKNKAAKKEKKEKKKKDKEIIQVIDEIEEDDGRINRLGAGIVFIFFGLLAMLMLVGTNVVSYTLSIQHATDYFEKQRYNEAYNEVYGIEFKAEDMVIYDKIMTVMFVNKQLNSYNNYYFLGKYPEALDSLLKGLRRYDKYIELATMLGIKTDLDYVRAQIIAELKNVFNISEKKAMKIISKEDMDEYSMEVYNIVLEKMKK